MITNLIIQGCLHNDRKCQRLLYEYCVPIMMRVCKRYTINEDEAVESMNASFMKILKKLDTLKDLQTLPAWVKQVTVNTSIDYYRAKKRYSDRNRFTIDTEYSNVQNTHFNMDFTESRMDSVEIFKLIQQLPDTSREVLNLVAIDGYSHREVAEKLNISEEASRWHLHKARKLMTEKLEKIHYTINAR
ncbi:RNA polymerase sigma factor SigV [Filimonas sp.]|nr:RNA polymerase sigma factor SigV [Filimonas sp.]